MATQTTLRPETTEKPKKERDGLLVVRQILKRAEQLDGSELRVLVEKLSARLEAGKEA